MEPLEPPLLVYTGTSQGVAHSQSTGANSPLMDSAPVPELVPLHLSPPSLSIASVNSPQTTYISLPPTDVCLLLLQVCG